MNDLAVTNIGHLTTNDGDPIREAVIIIRDGVIEYVGRRSDAPMFGNLEVLDCESRSVIPAFVDAHTHLLFAGDRSDELRRRMEGEDYTTIAAAGGGILSTVRATRAASKPDLFAEGMSRLVVMIENGTTALEIKSGYGLDLKTEQRILKVARLMKRETGIPIRITFLGAHAIPPEYANNRDGYVDLLLDIMLPAVADLADDCDVFIDRGAFTIDEGRAILTRAKELGMGLRVHAEQLSHTGAARLAAELGASSADHLDHATAEDAVALSEAGVAAVLTPGASFMMRQPQAPGPMFWEAGCVVAIATDCNPGTSFIDSMTFVISLAVIQMGLTFEQALWAATRGGALALGMEDRGILRSGAPGDFIVLNAVSPEHIVYRPATDLIWETFIQGEAP